jgi:hypothetical protein
MLIVNDAIFVQAGQIEPGGAVSLLQEAVFLRIRLS